MPTDKGFISELILQDGLRSARISCPANLIPSPGQYVLAADASDSPLSVPLFNTDIAPSSGTLTRWRHFIAAPPLPDSWRPGQELRLRGPLGRGFSLPVTARRVALVSYEDTPARSRGLIHTALSQGAAVVLVSESAPDSLPDEVEVQPLATLSEVCEWSDYMGFDVARENLPGLRDHLSTMRLLKALINVQVLVRTSMPCGGVAECGVCAVSLISDWKMACKDGPVFDWNDIAE